MAAMTHKLGTELQTGATECPVSGAHTQTARRSAGGELRIIHDETGADLSVYVTDPHKKQSFEAVLAANTPDKDIGDLVTVSDTKYVITQWEVTETNDDVKRVSVGLRTVDASLTAPGPTTTTNP